MLCSAFVGLGGPTSTAFIPYTQTTYDILNRMLPQDIKCLYTTEENLQLPSTCQGCFGIKDFGCIQSTHLNVARFILDKVVDLFKLESRNTVGIYS